MRAYQNRENHPLRQGMMTEEEYQRRRNALAEPWRRGDDWHTQLDRVLKEAEQLELPIPWSSPDADPLKDMHDVGEASRQRWLNGPPPGDPNPYACLGRDVEDDDEKQ